MFSLRLLKYFPNSFPFYIQRDSLLCGPTCLQILSKFYGKKIDTYTIYNLTGKINKAQSILDLRTVASKIGFTTNAYKVDYKHLDDIQIPCIGYMNNNHYVVIYKINNHSIYVSDPVIGLYKWGKKDFFESWRIDNTDKGIIIEVTPTTKFYQKKSFYNSKVNQRGILYHIKLHKNILSKIFSLMCLGLIVQLLIPFLTKYIVDIGIKNKDVDFIILILIGYFLLILGTLISEIIQSRFLHYFSKKFNIQMLSAFLENIYRLPLAFFEKRLMGDLLQRIYDHSRIESFISNIVLQYIFSGLSILGFSIVLISYNFIIFLIFIVGSVIYIIWNILFLPKRKQLDYKVFQKYSQIRDNTIQFIYGIQEIKLNNCSKDKLRTWQTLQDSLFQLIKKQIIYRNWQQAGSTIINQSKNLLIILFSSILVIEEKISLGTMFAIQYILGQLNGPINQMVRNIQSAQDASISMDRINEISFNINKNSLSKGVDILNKGDIYINNVSHIFDTSSKFTLENINLKIISNQITVILGPSGSGKSTLLKLLLKLYEPSHGEILFNNINFKNIDEESWRRKCGAVLQDGFIFNDTIINNVSMKIDNSNFERVEYVCKLTNINDYISSLPEGYLTKIGDEGFKLSYGQKQRILLARAIFNNPEFLFLDEPTNGLDSNNEKIIMKNIISKKIGRTVVIVAHRPSTIRNVNNIIVLDNGKIVEFGRHNELMELNGYYKNFISK